MRSVPMGKIIDFSVSRTKLILFQPFSIKKWLCLLLIAFLAGTISSGGNFNTNLSDFKKFKKAQTSKNQAMVKNNDQPATNHQYNTRNALKKGQPNRNYSHATPRKSSAHPWIIAGIIIFLAMLILPLILLFIWLAARFKFIWFNSIVKNDASIAKPFGNYKKEGNSLFGFYIVIFFATTGFFGLLALWVFTMLKSHGLLDSTGIWSFTKVMNIFLAPGLLAVAAIIFLALLRLAVGHFVVTIMTMDNISFKQAWKKFMDVYKKNSKELWFYLLVLMGLGIACGIIALMIAIALFLAILLAGLVIFGVPFFLLGMLLKIMPLFVVYAVIVGIPFIALAVLLMISVNLPFAVFFRSLSLYFLSSLDCKYNPLPLE